MPEFKHTPTFDVTGMPPNTAEQLIPTKLENEDQEGYTGLHELIGTSAEVMTLDMEINNTQTQQHHTLKQEHPDIPVSGNPTPMPIFTKHAKTEGTLTFTKGLFIRLYMYVLLFGF